MNKLNKEDYKICIVGLGYVGLPLAARFSLKGFDVTGYDIKEERVNQLKDGVDVNNDICNKNLKIISESCKLTFKSDQIKDCNVYIVTVPTPINDDKTPDLQPLISSSEIIGSVLKKDSIVIYESTVYPGVTDEICTPILEKKSNLTFNQEFSTGYSPERIVPGDTVNTIEKIKKIVSASNGETLKIISFLYSSIIDAGIHEAPSIKVAEAAKVTENIQRDVNIALINEMHQLYTSIGISTLDVIEAASTKWNFMKLIPGMVGGHCISIDPYYLMHKSEISGYSPTIMRASRKINDEMSNWVFKKFLEFSDRKGVNLKNTEITFLGYTFKENCSDTRNTKVKELIQLVKGQGIKVGLWDPIVNQTELRELEKEGVKIYTTRPQKIDFAFLCVNHYEINIFLESYKGLIFNYKNIDFN
jgi:UDP-N-acetyl-D-galactosamine dehydrogenase